VLQCVTVCCNVLQCVAVCCSLMQCVAVTTHDRLTTLGVHTSGHVCGCVYEAARGMRKMQ